MKPVCNSIHIFVTVCFVVISLSLVGIICWREFIVHKQDTRITRENLIKYYPTIFGQYSKYYPYKKVLLDTAGRRKMTNTSFNRAYACSYGCDKTTGGRKRRSTELNHACCQSRPTIVAPTTYVSKFNGLRELVQFNNTGTGFPILQVFLQEICSQANDCTGCTCTYLYQITSAVVYRFGFSSATATDMSHLEVDLFELQGCCKCINVGT